MWWKHIPIISYTIPLISLLSLYHYIIRWLLMISISYHMLISYTYFISYHNDMLMVIFHKSHAKTHENIMIYHGSPRNMILSQFSFTSASKELKLAIRSSFQWCHGEVMISNLPSGYLTYPLVNLHSYGKSPFSWVNPTISMAIFHS